MKKQKIIAFIIVVVLAVVFKVPLEWPGSDQGDDGVSSNGQTSQSKPLAKNDHQKLTQLIDNKQSGVMITIDAKVSKILSDDLKGSKHQRMILSVLNTNYSLLLAHNIDVAPRVPVNTNDIIRVYGQYEWNDKGGVIHWTHRDKRNKHPHGWIEHNNNRYQ